MKFKDQLEREVFEVVTRVVGVCAEIEHNKNLIIEDTNKLEVATFGDPPKKEIDVIEAGFKQRPGLKLLISCKNYADKAEPCDVQEWGAVVTAMNKYALNSEYLGIVICPSGFTSGCEGWATMNNLGLIPMVSSDLIFARGTVLRMVDRVIAALNRRLFFPYERLHEAPTFSDFCYHLIDGFQNRETYIREQFPDRFVNLSWAMPATFAELVKRVRGQKITALILTGALGVHLSEGDVIQARDTQLAFGPSNYLVEGETIESRCTRFTSWEGCSVDLIKGITVGQRILTLGDWEDRLELGLSNRVTLSISADMFHVDYTPPLSLSRFG